MIHLIYLIPKLKCRVVLYSRLMIINCCRSYMVQLKTVKSSTYVYELYKTTPGFMFKFKFKRVPSKIPHCLVIGDFNSSEASRKSSIFVSTVTGLLFSFPHHFKWWFTREWIVFWGESPGCRLFSTASMLE